MLDLARKMLVLLRMSPFVLLLLLVYLGTSVAEAQELICSGYEPPTPTGALAKRTRIAPTTGTVNVLVVYAKFKDEAPGVDGVPAFADQLFDENIQGSFSHFYNEMSDGQLTVRGTVLPNRYSSFRPKAAYLNHEHGRYGRYPEFVSEILTQVDQDVDLGRFDNDGVDGKPNSGDDDGFVDYIFVNILSTPRGFITGGATGIANLGSIMLESKDVAANGGTIAIGGSIRHGALQQEGNFAQTVGSMAHEFGHRLGLPDLYDLSYRSPKDDSAGIGRWGLMGWGAHGWTGQDGPAPFSAWSLEQLGWIGQDNENLIEIDSDAESLEIVDLLSDGNVYKVPIHLAGGKTNNFTQEYLLLEQISRSSSFYRRNIPGEGLLLWHVRPQIGGNGDEASKSIDLICADGLYADLGFPSGRIVDAEFGGDNLDFWSHDDSYTRANNGNFGDATDPFDGVQFTAFNQHSNPSNNPQGRSSSATTGVSLRFQRDGAKMIVDVVQPRWAGIINEQVHWAGDVIVDGDVKVANDGELHIHSDTRVRVSGSDRLFGGLDPRLSEFEINGDLIVGDVVASDIIIEALHPGDSWYGILIDPADSSRIEMSASSIVLDDVLHGFIFERAPFALQEPLLDINVNLIDDSATETVGNGDGTLNPGEIVQLELTIDNWTLDTYRRVRPEMSWNSSMLGPAWERSGTSNHRRKLKIDDSFTLYPGKSHTDVVTLAVSKEAEPGTEIRVVVDYGHRIIGRTSARHTSRVVDIGRDTLNFVVTGKYSQNDVDFEVPDREIRGRSVLVPPTTPTRVRALVQGDIAAADLMLRTVAGSKYVVATSMEKTGVRGDRHIFEAVVPAGYEGYFEAFVRVHGANGLTTLADSTLLMGVMSISEDTDVLAFVGNTGPEDTHDNVVAALERATTTRDLSQYVIRDAPSDETLYELLLPNFVGANKTIVWIGGSIGIEVQEHLMSFLNQGGRMLMAMQDNRTMRYGRRFASEVLHITQSRSSAKGLLYGLDLHAPEPIESTYRILNLQMPAEPMLFDEHYNAAAMRVDTGTFRAVFLPFNPGFLDEDMAASLIQSSLAFLSSSSIPATIEFSESEQLGESVLVKGNTLPLAIVNVSDEVVRAKLDVRHLPTLQLHQTFDLRKDPNIPGRFEELLSIAEPGSYLISARIYDDQGSSLPNSARSEVLRLFDRPNLVLTNVAFSARDRVKMRSTIKRAMAANQTEADIIDYPQKDNRIYEDLILSYAGEGRALFWFGDFGDKHVTPILGKFLDKGGHLFLASRGGASMHGLKDLAGKYLFTSVGSNASSSLVSLISNRGMDYSFNGRTLNHRKLSPESPAVPLVVGTDGQIAGIHVANGGYRAVYYSFDAANVGNAENLLKESVGLLRENLNQEAVLEIPGAFLSDRGTVLLAGVEQSIRVVADGEAVEAEVLIKGLGLGHGQEVTLSLLEQQSAEERIFDGSWMPPLAGNYRMFIRTRDRSGAQRISSHNVGVEAVSFAQWEPVLIVDNYPKLGRPIVADVLDQLMQHGLGANVLTYKTSLSDPSMCDALLQHYVGAGKFVVWLAPRVSGWQQEAISSFVGSGGRILVASPGFGYSSTVDTFKNEVLGIGSQHRNGGFGKFENLKGNRRGGTIPFQYVVPLDGTEPLLADSKGRVTAVRKDAGRYRTIYIGLHLTAVTSESRMKFLGDQIAFLWAGAKVESVSKLEIKSVLSPGTPVRAGDVAPRLLVANSGNGNSQPFRIEYRIFRNDKIVASREIQQSALEAFSDREIELPLVSGLPGGHYELQVGISTTFDGLTNFIEARPLELIEVPVTYSSIDMEGDLNYSNGAGFFDMDGDGDLDFMLVRQGHEDQLLLNDGDAFVEIGADIGLADGGVGRGFAVGDYDADGDLDLYLVRQGQENRLMRNENGSFSDVTAQFTTGRKDGVPLGDAGSGRSAGFWDGDADGDLDLFLVNASPDTNRFFRNDGIFFTDVAPELGLDDAGDGRGMSFGDFDRDGDADLLVANKGGPSRLYRNGGGIFSEVGQEFGIPFSNNDVAGIFGDYDGDGFVDIFTTGESSVNRLFKNLDGAGFHWVNENTAGDFGTSCAGAAFVDVDNDGDLDLFTTGVGRSNGGDQLFNNDNDGWRSLGAFSGLAKESAGRGLSVADFDGDGDQDLLVADAIASRLYRSELESSHWLQLDLIGTGANRHALGARVHLVTSQGRQYRELHPGFGYGSQAPPKIHFGLGEETQVDTLRIVWPDGRESLRTTLEANGQLKVSYPEAPMSMAAEVSKLPEALTLFPNFPNPFNAQTVINFNIDQVGPVEFSIFNATGQRIRYMVVKAERSGLHSITWDGTDDAGRAVGTGMYLYKLSAGGQVKTDRLLLMK